MHKIMLIEDDTTMLSLLHTLLQMEGYQVVEVKEESLEEILAIAEQESPNLVFLDVHLKSINGLDLLRRMKERSRLGKVHILMASGMDMRVACLTAGADGFILKPFMPDDLLQQIQKALEN